MAEAEGPLVAFERHEKAMLGTIRDPNVLSGLQVVSFGKFVLEYAAANPGTNLMLNFEHVSHLSSSAISELIRIKEALKKSDGRLAVCGLRDDIIEVFEITNMLELLHVHRDESVAAALTKFNRAIDIAGEEDAWKQKRGES